MAIQAAAPLLPLYYFCAIALDRQELPIIRSFIESELSFDHYRQH
jgi:hypothetical protein